MPLRDRPAAPPVPAADDQPPVWFVGPGGAFFASHRPDHLIFFDAGDAVVLELHGDLADRLAECGRQGRPPSPMRHDSASGRCSRPAAIRCSALSCSRWWRRRTPPVSRSRSSPTACSSVRPCSTRSSPMTSGLPSASTAPMPRPMTASPGPPRGPRRRRLHHHRYPMGLRRRPNHRVVAPFAPSGPGLEQPGPAPARPLPVSRTRAAGHRAPQPRSGPAPSLAAAGAPERRP